MSVREDIKAILAQENWTLSDVAAEMTKITGKSYSGPNLSQKMSRKTLKYEEARLIGKIVGYNLCFCKQN